MGRNKMKIGAMDAATRARIEEMRTQHQRNMDLLHNVQLNAKERHHVANVKETKRVAGDWGYA
jgi:hypothetical protein